MADDDTVMTDYCTSGPPDERKRQWIIFFDDPDKGVMVFDDELEAHKKWDQAKDNWTCTLFETSERKFEWRAGQLRKIAPVQAIQTEQDLIEREAKRRCRAAGYSLERRACEDRRFSHDNLAYFWDAFYGNGVRLAIEQLRNAGFVVSAPSSPTSCSQDNERG